MDLTETLRLHALYLSGDPAGVRANLWGADLGRANLVGADLRGANLWSADLWSAKGFLYLTQTDHGYLVYASWTSTEWRIMAGCRYFSITEARAHWSSPDYHLPQSGSRIVALLDWLEKQPTPEKETQP